MDVKIDDKRRKDYDNPKVRKHISMTPQVVGKIQAFSAENNLSFSAAMESLALIGLGDNEVLAMLPIIDSMLKQSFNRIAKLAAFAAIEAGTAKEMNSAILLQLMQNQHMRYGDQMGEMMQVEKGHPARKWHGKIVGIGRNRAVRRLKKPLTEIEDILRAEGVDE